MKKLILFFAVLAFSINSYAQCTPLAPSGNPGLTPAPSAVPCIERGVFYETFLYFENFTSFSCGGFTANVVSATIDDMQNFPCGINWQADQNSYAGGETGCIRIYGTSTDAVGEYALEVEMTFTLSIFGQNYPVSGTLAQLQAQLSQFGCSAPAVNTDYFSRVIDTGNPCPAIGASPSRTSSGTTCPTPTLAVTISGANASPLCAGASDTLSANATNAVGNVTYAWSNSATTQSITVSPASNTTYTVTVTAQNGTATASASLTVNQRPNTAFTATPSGLNATLNNTTTGATSYAWTFGDGQTSAAQSPGSHTYAGSGTYTITLIASNTCGSDTATQSVTVTGGSGPSVSISGNTTVCAGTSTTLTANASGTTGNVTYMWSTGGSTSAITVSPANTTTYTVTVTAQNGTASNSATVTVNQRPNAAFTATPSGATATINNTTTGATSYAWNFGNGQTSTAQNPGTHTYTGNGTFTITLIATNSCGTDTATAQVTVAVTNGPSVTISGNTTVCSGTSTALTANVQNATGAVTYLWTPGNSTSQTLTVNPTTTTLYTVAVTAQNGTAGNTATVTVNNAPNAAFSASLSGATVTINNATTGATSFSWNFGDGELSALQNPLDHTYTSNGTFTITLEATNGCGTTTVTETVTVVGVGMDDIATAVGVKIYPNPFDAVATVEVESISGDFNVALYSLTGLMVQQQRMNTQKFTIEKGALSPGVYFIEVSNARVVKRSKVVIY